MTKSAMRNITILRHPLSLRGFESSLAAFELEGVWRWDVVCISVWLFQVVSDWLSGLLLSGRGFFVRIAATAAPSSAMKAVTRKLNDLRTSWTANPIRTMSLSASTLHSFYKYESGATSNTYVWENGGLPWLKNFRFNFRLRLQGKGEATRKNDRNLPQSFEEQQMMETDPDEMNILEEELRSQNNR